MNTRNLLFVLAVGAGLLVSGCQAETTSNAPAPAPASKSTIPSGPAALPENGFKAAITLVDAPSRLRPGQKQTIQVRVKNGSDVMWYARGAEVNTNPDNKFYLAAGNRWLKGADETLVTDMDGRHGLDRNLKPGEETEVPLLVTAPNEPGDYVLEIDIVQEQVAWFRDKGSPTAKTKISVVK